jgi:hypothetical protein
MKSLSGHALTPPAVYLERLFSLVVVLSVILSLPLVFLCEEHENLSHSLSLSVFDYLDNHP